MLLIFITLFIRFSGNSEVAKTNDSRFYDTKYTVLLVTVTKNLTKVVLQQYNYPKLI